MSKGGMGGVLGGWGKVWVDRGKMAGEKGDIGRVEWGDHLMEIGIGKGGKEKAGKENILFLIFALRGDDLAVHRVQEHGPPFTADMPVREIVDTLWSEPDG